MLNRLVKMTFKEEGIKDFLSIFEQASPKIRSFEGCKGVKLLQDKNKPNIFFTFSLWETEEHLEKYRTSELFKETWKATKAPFTDKPEAWSTLEK